MPTQIRANGTDAPSIVTGILDEIALLLVPLVDEALFSGAESFGVLAHTVRRKVLSVLLAEERTTRSRLANHLAADDDVSLDVSRRLEIALHHTHLPKLEDGQYVEYDTRTGDVVLWKNPDTIEAALESA